jgi:hypothetical protein
VAYFEVREAGSFVHIAIVHAWTPDGYEVVHRFPSFWDWFKYAIDGVVDWVAQSTSI